MYRLLFFCLVAVLSAGFACSEGESTRARQSAEAKDTTAPKPKTRPVRPVRSGPPDFSSVETELVRYADWYGRMTELQEQEASAEDAGPLNDFGRKLVGRTFRFTGRVANVERSNGQIVVHLDHYPRSIVGRVQESGEALQGVFYSEGEFAKRRYWRLSIILPDDVSMRGSAEAWRKSQWLAFDGVVEATEGFELERNGTKASFAKNKHRVVAASSCVAEGDYIGPHSRVAILLDDSGLRPEYRHFGITLSQEFLRSLPAGSQFLVARSSDDKVLPNMTPVSETTIAAACSALQRAPSGGNVDISSAVDVLQASRPTHVILMRDAGLYKADAGVADRLANLPKTRSIVVLIKEDGDPWTTVMTLPMNSDSNAQRLFPFASVFRIQNADLFSPVSQGPNDVCEWQIADVIRSSLPKL